MWPMVHLRRRMHASFVPVVRASVATAKKACIAIGRRQAANKSYARAAHSVRTFGLRRKTFIRKGSLTVVCDPPGGEVVGSTILSARGPMGCWSPYRNHRTTRSPSRRRRCVPSMSQSSMSQSSASILSRLGIGRSWRGPWRTNEKESKTAGRQRHCVRSSRAVGSRCRDSGATGERCH